LADAPREKLSTRFPKQAPVPEGTVGSEAKLRREILQLSLFPNLVNKKAMMRSPGNVDFGEDHMIPC
jgi:hypothetical protein